MQSSSYRTTKIIFTNNLLFFYHKASLMIQSLLLLYLYHLWFNHCLYLYWYHIYHIYSHILDQLTSTGYNLSTNCTLSFYSHKLLLVPSLSAAKIAEYSGFDICLPAMNSYWLRHWLHITKFCFCAYIFVSHSQFSLLLISAKLAFLKHYKANSKFPELN